VEWLESEHFTHFEETYAYFGAKVIYPPGLMKHNISAVGKEYSYGWQ
jgi:hypothetical protein